MLYAAMGETSLTSRTPREVWSTLHIACTTRVDQPPISKWGCGLRDYKVRQIQNE